jgi:hypothetical protein
MIQFARNLPGKRQQFGDLSTLSDVNRSPFGFGVLSA